MKRILLLASCAVLFLAQSTVTRAAVIDTVFKETFGEIPVSADPHNAAAKITTFGWYSATGSYYHLTDTVNKIFTTENGYWAAGADTSVRTEIYFVSGPRVWADSSSRVHLCLVAPTRYGGAWDTAYLMNVDIKNYTNLELKLGWGKRGGWVNPIENIRGLAIEYRIDGGDWTMMDTTQLENPLAKDLWSYARELYIDETGDALDLRFTAYISDNQIAVDDIILLGEKAPSGIEDIGSAASSLYFYVADDHLYVRNSEYTGNLSVAIYNIAGSMVYQKNTFRDGEYLNLKPGVYVVKSWHLNNSVVQKIIVK
ncbi:MAG: T9SS type A sorting domain-containing protein [Bacteroidales bacterium]|nr:T9SS type A sorting domain-containing protein [Bacteroidales bacterium]